MGCYCATHLYSVSLAFNFHCLHLFLYPMQDSFRILQCNMNVCKMAYVLAQNTVRGQCWGVAVSCVMGLPIQQQTCGLRIRAWNEEES